MRNGVSSPLAVAAPGGEPGANERGSGLSAPLPPRTPWRLPARGLAVFQGDAHTARLSHYFLPRVLLQGKRVLMLDGANCADPRLPRAAGTPTRRPFPAVQPANPDCPRLHLFPAYRNAGTRPALPARPR